MIILSGNKITGDKKNIYIEIYVLLFARCHVEITQMQFEELSSNSEDQLRQVNPTRVKQDMLSKYF